jgi:hypothetical protein
MFLELVATFVAGLAVAGVAMLLNVATGRRLPRWIIPVAAGLGMIGMTISNEYSWFPRTSETLPEGLVIAETVEKQSFYQPWTYVAPYVDRFVAVDAKSMRQNPAQPDMLLFDAYFYGRWSPLNRMAVVVDCAEGRRAPLSGDAEFGADGSIANARWFNAGLDDPIIRTACEVS